MLTRTILRITAVCALSGTAMSGYCMAGMQGPKQAQETPGRGRVPQSIAAEHDKLHDALARLTRAQGQTGIEARNVKQLLQPHFAKEEQFALPPLAALAELASGGRPANAAEIIRMSAFLQGDMPAMLAEHRAIAQALDRLRAAGRKEGKKEAVAFAAHLKAHARQEEEILYPTAILVGRYLKLQQQ